MFNKYNKLRIFSPGSRDGVNKITTNNVECGGTGNEAECGGGTGNEAECGGTRLKRPGSLITGTSVI